MASDRLSALGLGFGGISDRELIPRRQSLADFLGVDDNDPSISPTFSSAAASASWQGQLSQTPSPDRSPEQSQASGSGACTRPEARLPDCRSGEVQKFTARLSTEVLDHDRFQELAEVDRGSDTNSNRGKSNSFSSHEDSFGSCEDEGALAVPAAQVSSESTSVDPDSSVADSSERSSSSQGSSLRDDAPGGSAAVPGPLLEEPTLALEGIAKAVTNIGTDPEKPPTSEEPCRSPAEPARLNDAHQLEAQEPCRSPAMFFFKQGWWEPARLNDVHQLEIAVPFTRLIAVRIVAGTTANSSCPLWSKGESTELYEQMGVNDPSRSYVAYWMNVGKNLIVCTSEVLDVARLESCLAKDPFGQRLKLLLHPVKVSLPFPAKGPKDADFVGQFFSKSSFSITRFSAKCGADLTVVQLDLYSKWLIKTAITKVGFRLGNEFEMILLDWVPEAPSALSAYRLIVDEEFTRLLTA